MMQLTRKMRCRASALNPPQSIGRIPTAFTASRSNVTVYSHPADSADRLIKQPENSAFDCENLLAALIRNNKVCPNGHT